MSAPNNRLLALDVIRGITIAGMILVNNPGSWQSVYAPLQHARWHGLTPTDLVYPFFMFIMGVAIHFSLRKFDKLNTTVSLKIIRRTVALFAVGIALDCFSKLCYGTFSWEHLRILGVMQRLALAYAGGAFLAILIPKKYYLATAGGILLLYLVLLQCFNGYVHSADNLIAVIDVKLLGAGHLIKEAAEGGSFAFEPEGLLSTIPCWAHVLFGTFVGSLITGIAENKERIRQIALFGTVLLFAGFLLQYLDPINKKLWTASYTLITSGTASLLLALLIDIIDVRQKKRWCRFFEALCSCMDHQRTVRIVIHPVGRSNHQCPGNYLQPDAATLAGRLCRISGLCPVLHRGDMGIGIHSLSQTYLYKTVKRYV